MAVLFLLLLAGGVAAQECGTVRGVVLDIRGGEPLARVSVQLPGVGLATVTDADGQFAISSVPLSEQILHVSTVGYRLLKEPLTLSPNETKEFEVVLNPDTFRHAHSVEVRTGTFDPIRQSLGTYHRGQ